MRRPRTGSVRFRVTRLAVLIVAGLLIGVATALVIVQQLTLTAALDTNLRQRAEGLASQLAISGIPASLPGTSDENATQLVDMSGTVVAWSVNLEGAGPVAADPLGRETIGQLQIEAAGDETFRVLSRPVTIGDDEYVLHVAAARDDVTDSVRVLAISLAVAVPVVSGLLAAVVWWLVGRSLQPVEAIRSEVASIGTSELHRRVPEPADDDEIAALARTMNDMLLRVEDGVARQQAFVADASHELRSPLTRIRSELEVDLAATSTSDPMATHASVLHEAIEMQRLVEDLLYLARSDAGDHTLRAAAVDLDDVVLAEIGRLGPLDGVTVDASGVSGAQVWGDHVQLARAVRNLVDNAVRHAVRDVRLSLVERDTIAEFSVTDDGPGVPAGQTERIFERFGRADEGRSRAEGGAGLGLAITADIARRHGGSVRVDTSHQGGARFVLRLPLLVDSADGD